MAIKDTTVGLLSKMAKFVRHPTKDWSELDHIGVEAESEIERGYTKQSLKEMIERKRRNDFVRRREFDELRKLRRNVPLVNADAAGRPSFFQVTTTTSKLEERAETIKKIDEIEAQMSKQWWKGKQDEIALKGNNFPMSGRAALAVGEGVSKESTGSDKPVPVAVSRAPGQFRTKVLPRVREPTSIQPSPGCRMRPRNKRVVRSPKCHRSGLRLTGAWSPA